MEMTIPADPLYQLLLLAAEKKFWRCVETGETPRLFGVEPLGPFGLGFRYHLVEGAQPRSFTQSDIHAYSR